MAKGSVSDRCKARNMMNRLMHEKRFGLGDCASASKIMSMRLCVRRNKSMFHIRVLFGNIATDCKVIKNTIATVYVVVVNIITESLNVVSVDV